MNYPPPPPISPAAAQGHSSVAEQVTAVLVTRGPSLTLGDALNAIEQQDLRPRELIIVDTSHDEGATAQVRALADSRLQHTNWQLHSATRARNFGGAVRYALSLNPNQEPANWLWTLEDDAAPASNVLRLLLNAVEHSRSVAIAGTKQVRWDDPEVLLSVGTSATRLGHRFTGIEAEERDQGQHDGREDVLAVSLASALIRRSVWDSLAGTDPVLGPFGDSLDFGRRAHLAGHRVIVVPQAITAHAQLSHAGLRSQHSRFHRIRSPQTSIASIGPRRRAHLYTQFICSPLWLAPLLVLAAVLAAPLRAMGRLLAKEPTAARAEIGAALWLITKLPAGVSARMHTSRTSVMAARTLRQLEASRSDIASHRREERRIRAEIRSGGTRIISSLDLADYRAANSRRRRALALVFAGLTALTVAVFSAIIPAVIQGKPLTGPGLLPSNATAAQVWQAATSSWVSSDVGDLGPPEPLLLFLAPVTWLTGNAASGIGIFLLLCLLTAGLGAWSAAGLITRSNLLRTWTTLVWIAAPALTASLTQGRIGALVVHALLPWFVLTAAQALGQTPPRSPAPISARGMIISAASAGLLLAVIASASPAVFVLTAALFGVLALTRLRPRRHLAAILVPALAVLLPTVLYIAQDPGPHAWRILLNSTGSHGATNAPLWQLALGVPAPVEPWINGSDAGVLTGLSGLFGNQLDTTFWVDFTRWFGLGLSGLLVLLALSGFVFARHLGAAVRVGWFSATLGLVLATVGSSVLVGADEAGTFHAWSGPATSVITLGLLVAALAAAQGLARRWRSHKIEKPSRWTLVAIGICLLIPALTLAQWAVVSPLGNPSERLAVIETSQVPSVATHLQTGPRALRVLSLQTSTNTLQYRVLRHPDQDLVQRSAALEFTRMLRLVEGAPDPHTVALSQAVGKLAGGGASMEAANELAGFGIGIVVLEANPADEAWPQMVNSLDATAGLERVTDGEFGVMWRIVPTEPAGEPSWARVTDTNGESLTIPARGLRATLDLERGLPGRLLHLAERPDAGWHATLDGRELVQLTSPESPASNTVFEVGATGGELKIWYDWPLRWPWLATLGIVGIIYGLLAVPVGLRRFQTGGGG